MKFPVFILLLLVCFWVNREVSYAVPASGGNMLVTQSSNTIDVKLYGDEFLNWFQSSDNYILGLNSSGNWEYMGNVSDNLAFTGIELSSTADLSTVTPNDFPSSSFFGNTKASRNAKVISGNALPTSGTIHNLVVLVYFNDHTDSGNSIIPDSNYAISPQDTTSYGNVFSASSQSLSHYFKEMSRNSLTIQSYLTPWLQVSGNEQDYGADLSGNVDSGINQFYDDVIQALNSGNVSEMPALDGSIEYDLLTIIHSGQNQASLGASSNSNRIWSRWDYITSLDNITLGGVNIQISRLVTTSALGGGDGTQITDLGVLCHETAHHFGVPDLYEYREANYGIGTWGLMGLGSWGFSGNEQDGQNPMPLSAYTLDRLNWVTTTLRDVSSANVNLSEMEGGSEILKFRGNGDNEYYLMEYRDFNSSYYGEEISQIANPGALLYHVYTPAFSGSASDITHPIVRVIEADNNNSLASGNALVQAGDLWNASSVLNDFSIDSGSVFSHSGLYNTLYALPDVSAPSYNRIENLRVENGDLVFDFTGQRSSISIQDFNNGIIQWEPIEGAATYRLEREDNSSGTFNVILSGNNVTLYDDPDITGTVDFKYQVIASRYVGQSEFYSEEFFYGFSISSVNFDPNAGSLTLQFNSEVNLSSTNVFSLSGMRVLNSVGNTMFALSGSDASVYSFPGLNEESLNASFEVTSQATVSVEIALSTAQLYEMIQNSNSTNSDLLFEIDANSAEMKNDPFLNNSAQLHSAGLSLSISGTTDTSAPVLESAIYNDSLGQFILGYSEPIWFTSLDFTKLIYSESSETTDLDGSSFSISDNVLTITLNNEKKARGTLLNYISGNVTTLNINTTGVINLSEVGSNHSTTTLTVIEDSTDPYLESFILNNQDENQTLELFFNEGIFFPQGVPSSSADFEVVIVNSTGDELVSLSGNGYTTTAINDTSVSPNISRVDSVVINLLPSEIEDIDEAYGFVNPAPTAYVKINGVVFSDYRRYLDGLSHQVDTSKQVSSNNYTPKRRARFIHPHYDDAITESDEDEGLIWKSSHLVRWQINGGWEASDTLRLEWSQGGNTGVVAESFTLDSTSGQLNTTQSKLWDTTTVSDNAGYQFSLMRESDSKVYQASQNTIEVDNTRPTVYFTYLSNSNPTNWVNADVTVNPNLHSFNLNSQEQLANIIIVANYDEPMIASPTLTINQQGSVDPVVTMSPSEGTLPSNVFYYAYDVIEQDSGNYTDGFAQISITDERDRARGHLLVDSDPESESILGNVSEEVDPTTVFFSIDTIPPTISSLEFSITFESIVTETSELKLKFSESLYNKAGDELITGVLDPDNYFLSGSSATDGLKVMSVSVDSQGEYTLELSGIVDLGNLVLSIFQENITDFHNNAFGIPNTATAVWPGPLINLHEVVLSKGGRTRLVLRGGFTPYEHFIAPIYNSIVTLDSDDEKTIYGVGNAYDEFYIDVTENRGQVRIVRGELSEPRVNSVTSNLNTYRDLLDFQMVSFPFNLSSWDGEGLFELLKENFGTHGVDYVLYHYDESSNYVPVESDTSAVGPGYGFWMASRRENKSAVEAEGPLLEQVVAVDLHEGWNLIGNPFDVDLSVDQIYVSTDATRYNISDVTQSETGHKLWYIDINLPEYQSVSTLAPFMGAWLYVENSAGAEVMFFRTPENPDLEIYFPPEKPSSSKAVPPASEAFPPIRPLSYSSPNASSSSSSEDGGGGGGGCLLKSIEGAER